MNPDFSLSDWMKNWGTLKSTTVSTYEWWEIGGQARSSTLVGVNRLVPVREIPRPASCSQVPCPEMTWMFDSSNGIS